MGSSWIREEKRLQCNIWENATLNTVTSDDLNQSTFCQAHGLKVDRIYLSTLYCFISVLLQTDEKAKEMTYLCTVKQRIHFGSNFRSSHIATRLHLHYFEIRVCIPNNKQFHWLDMTSTCKDKYNQTAAPLMKNIYGLSKQKQKNKIVMIRWPEYCFSLFDFLFEERLSWVVL